MKAPVYNHAGQVVREEELDPRVFNVTPEPTFLHSIVTSLEGNRRRAIAHTKTRSEVRGGGRKPWKQKHTGRARHGSTRSPIWVGGGVTFGPRSDRNYITKINKKAAKKAFRMCISAKALDGKLLLIESWAVPALKTKAVKTILSALHLPLEKKHAALLVTHEKVSDLVHAARNIASVATVGKENMNVLDLLRYPYVVMTPRSLAHVTKMYSGNATV